MMATSSKMAVVSTANSDLPRRESSICSLSTFLADDDDNRHHKHQSMTMDDILRNIYSSTGTGTGNDMHDNGHHQQLHHHAEARSVDEVWKEIVAGGVGVGVGEEEVGVAEGDGRDQVRAGEGGGGGGGGMEEMTLEDFLTRARAVREEDVSVNAGGVPIGYGQFQVQPPPPPPPPVAQGQLVYANGTTSTSGGGGGGGGGRAGKRRAVQEAPLDKATQQKQRRMIKNRESAARSRERKQAYTVELESLVTQLEEENARLLRQQAEQKKERFKRLMENLIPVVEKRRPPRVLRRVRSVHW